MRLLPPEPIKFAFNAVLERPFPPITISNNGKKDTDICPLCPSGKQTLLHMINTCSKTMDLYKYSRSHDEVLEHIVFFTKDHLPPSFPIIADLPESTYMYLFPQHNTPTNQRPDRVWWSNADKTLWLLELTISIETVMEGSTWKHMEASGSTSKYQELVIEATAAEHLTELITLEIG